MKMKQYVFPALCFCIVVVVGFPSGPPEKACFTMSPLEGHGRSQATPEMVPPYQLLVSNLTYGPRQQIKVILTGDVNFRGFFVQARSMDELSAVPIGTFRNPHVGSKVMSCSLSPQLKNAWSHKDLYHKSDMSVTWLAPSTDHGDIFFRATVVKSRHVYWENIFSDIISYNGPIIQYEGGTNGGSRHLASITNILLHIISILMFYY